MEHVPYRSGAEAGNDIASGNLKVACITVPSALPAINAGKGAILRVQAHGAPLRFRNRGPSRKAAIIIHALRGPRAAPSGVGHQDDLALPRTAQAGGCHGRAVQPL
ncbi:hypothetical protein F0Q34_21500 [Pseudoroseomonas oryzae]|uniref:Uncharacterized protein n=1 Tax=Teichococcus oryzae TaxID=1608942 RepID=A0A5B2T922_9PROT|nr:hypothetical protein F0Q34_21500 [Pseudoroseomonas oryzae]